MKVLIVNTMAPFVWGGAEALADSLVHQLELEGHRAENLRIPFRWQPADVIPSQMLLVRALELFNVDRVIALKFPAYLIRHPHKTVWLLHQYRQAYDLLGTELSNLENTKDSYLKDIIRNSDREALGESKACFLHFARSTGEVRKFNNIRSKVLIPPVIDPEQFEHCPSEGYVFAGGRVNEMKRQHLLIEAVAYAPSAVRLVIAGPVEDAKYARRLGELVEKQGLEERVTLDLRLLSRAEYAEYLTRSAAVAYLPVDEDSLSYVATEAATAGKPVITASDSGGVLGLVEDGSTGWVVPPVPESLGAVLVEACNSVNVANNLGEALRERWLAMGITWHHTLETLLK